MLVDNNFTYVEELVPSQIDIAANPVSIQFLSHCFEFIITSDKRVPGKTTEWVAYLKNLKISGVELLP